MIKRVYLFRDTKIFVTTAAIRYNTTSLYKKEKPQIVTRSLVEIIRAATKTPFAHNFFSNRVIHKWNMLSKHFVSAVSINAYKSKFNKCVQNSESVLKKWAKLRINAVNFNTVLRGHVSESYSSIVKKNDTAQIWVTV